MDGTRFNIYSGLLKASRSADGKMRLHGVASSTTRDLHGDTMEESALQDMERAANGNLTIFLNHSYEVPEDVAGSVEVARLKTRDADHAGNPNVDLDMDIVINEENERAVKTFRAIEKGTKLGLSIGALIPPDGAIRDKKSGTYQIQHVQLLETSLVGIPANPRSWVEYAAKSLRASEVPEDQTFIGYTENLSSSTTVLTNGTNGDNYYQPSTTFDTVQWNGTSPNINVGGYPVIVPEIVDSYQSTCDDCQPGKPCAAHKAVEPDVTDATINIQIDTEPVASSDSSSQEGSETDPESDDVVAGGDDAVTPELEPDTVQRMLALLQATTGEVVTARTRIVELEAQLSAVIGERDAAREEAQTVFRETKRILDKVADHPLVRRAVVVEAQKDFRQKFSGYYSDDFLKLMES